MKTAQNFTRIFKRELQSLAYKIIVILKYNKIKYKIRLCYLKYLKLGFNSVSK